MVHSTQTSPHLPRLRLRHIATSATLPPTQTHEVLAPVFAAEGFVDLSEKSSSEPPRIAPAASSDGGAGSRNHYLGLQHLARRSRLAMGRPYLFPVLDSGGRPAG